MAQVYSVTELNAHIKALVDADPVLAGVCVRGELSNYKVYPSGHHYFSLKDAGGTVRCVMFRGSAGHLRFRPENGMQVLAQGRVSVYPRDGAYQLYCETLQPEGAGDLAVAFEQLRKKLEAEGLFDAAHKKPLPRYPLRIGVITSGAGAAVHDVIRVLRKRWPLARILVLPVRVQGEEAPPEIVGAIRYANRWQVADLLIVGRGGGSMEDLWAFNDERVARAIYDSVLPVISAVGHEPDVTIADYVADLRAATPSNGAELAAPDMAELREALAAGQIRLSQAMRRELVQHRRRLEDLAGRKVMHDPGAYVDMRRMELDSVRARLIAAAERTAAEKRRRYVGLAASQEALSPLKVLARGYSVATGPAGVIRSVRTLFPGDIIRLRLSDGIADCTVETTKED